MAMYTALHFNSELNIERDCEVAEVLKFMVGDIEDEPKAVPKIPLFGDTGWRYMLQMDSYYFDEDTHSTLRWDDIAKAYYLCIRCNLKNYNSEIEQFITWIAPYCAEKENGDFLGFYRYEEDETPTIIRYGEMK